jgi:two-component system chemotaxis sensor kinase CheA
MDEMYAELLVTFVAESMDFLDEVEPQLIFLATNAANGVQSNSDTADLVNRVFRLVHTIKGNSQIFQIGTVSKLAHHAEGLLASVRQGKLVLDAPRVDALCRALDLLRKILGAVVETKSDDGFMSSVVELATELDALNDVDKPADSGMQFDDGICWVETPAELAPSQEGSESSGNALPPVPVGPELKQLFVQESTELLDVVEAALLRLRNEAVREPEIVEDAFRAMHSFKGSCGFVGLSDMQGLAHAVEDVLDQFRKDLSHVAADKVVFLLEVVDGFQKALAEMDAGRDPVVPNLQKYLMVLMAEPEAAPQQKLAQPAKGVSPKEVPKPASSPTAGSTPATGGGVAERARQDVRVDLKKLDGLVDLVGELVIAEAMVAGNPLLTTIEDERLEKSFHQLRRITLDLQDVAMSVRMVPLAQTFKKMVRIVHDVAHKTNKKARLILKGEETEVDRTVVEKISDPLVHAVRNSIDHGLESPEERLAIGKEETGTVTIEARHESGEVWILVRDDGRGLNRDRILKKALERGIVSEERAATMSDQEVCDLVFEAGFSTAEKLTDVSGRGVGMDVVRRNIEELNGRVTIESEFGKGTTLRIQLPLTLAVIDGMLVRVGDAKYTIPLLSIQESLRPAESMLTKGPDGQDFVSIRNELIPIVRLSQMFRVKGSCEALTEGSCIVVNARDKSLALYVDEILGQQQTVIKAMPRQLMHGKTVSGCTILGNGEISLIVDVGGISSLMRTQYERLVGAK